MPAQRQDHPRVQAPSKITLTSGSVALATALAPLDSGEGFRLGLLGDTGCGKSHLASFIVAAYLKHSRGIVAVANSKGDPWPKGGIWPAEHHESPSDLTTRPPQGRVVVFTPDAFGDPLSLEEIARWQWRLARKGWPSLGVYDEISDGAVDGEFLDPDDGERLELPRVFTHGRRPGISAVWGAQFAQQVPREPFEQSSCVFVWRQAGNALAILQRRHYLEGDGVADAILSLPGGDVPPSERGAFVMLRRARPWDGRIYRL